MDIFTNVFLMARSSRDSLWYLLKKKKQKSCLFLFSKFFNAITLMLGFKLWIEVSHRHSEYNNYLCYFWCFQWKRNHLAIHPMLCCHWFLVFSTLLIFKILPGWFSVSSLVLTLILDVYSVQNLLVETCNYSQYDFKSYVF